MGITRFHTDITRLHRGITRLHRDITIIHSSAARRRWRRIVDSVHVDLEKGLGDNNNNNNNNNDSNCHPTNLRESSELGH